MTLEHKARLWTKFTWAHLLGAGVVGLLCMPFYLSLRPHYPIYSTDVRTVAQVHHYYVRTSGNRQVWREITQQEYAGIQKSDVLVETALLGILGSFVLAQVLLRVLAPEVAQEVARQTRATSLAEAENRKANASEQWRL